MKYLALFLTLGFIFAPAMTLAAENCFGQSNASGNRVVASGSPCYTPKCYKGINGRGEIIKWAKTEKQCRYQSNGQSWGYPGNTVNIYHDTFRQ